MIRMLIQSGENSMSGHLKAAFDLPAVKITIYVGFVIGIHSLIV